MASPAAVPLSLKLLLGVLTLALIAGAWFLGLWGNLGHIGSPEHYASTFAGVLPFGYAFAAGVIASFNPCGFLMLPIFIGYQMADSVPEHADYTAAQLGRGAAMGITITLGFLTLFAAIGTIVASGGSLLFAVFPWAGLLAGVVMAAIGLWLLVTGRGLGFAWASRVSSPAGRGWGKVFLYGIAYGAVSLSCTLPIFLVVVATSLAGSGFVHSVGQFISYALGMGVVITAFTMAASAARAAMAQRLKALFPYLHRLSALFLLGAGAYLIVYWVWLGHVLG